VKPWDGNSGIIQSDLFLAHPNLDKPPKGQAEPKRKRVKSEK